MLGWSLNLFRIRGILLSVHFTFILFVAYFGWDGWRQAGTPGLLWSVATILAIFTCVVLHELGHSFTAMHFGIGVRRILLMPIGGMAEFDSVPRQPSRELLITLAGPAVNFVLAAALGLVVGLPRGWQSGEIYIPGNLEGLGQMLVLWNLAMGIFNLLPSFPMDGGRILRALLAIRMNFLRATFWAATIGKILCVGGILYASLNELPMLAVLFGFIFVAGELEYRAEKRRAMEEEYWRQMADRTPVPVPE